MSISNILQPVSTARAVVIKGLQINGRNSRVNIRTLVANVFNLHLIDILSLTFDNKSDTVVVRLRDEFTENSVLSHDRLRYGDDLLSVHYQKNVKPTSVMNDDSNQSKYDVVWHISKVPPSWNVKDLVEYFYSKYRIDIARVKENCPAYNAHKSSKDGKGGKIDGDLNHPPKLKVKQKSEERKVNSEDGASRSISGSAYFRKRNLEIDSEAVHHIPERIRYDEPPRNYLSYLLRRQKEEERYSIGKRHHRQLSSLESYDNNNYDHDRDRNWEREMDRDCHGRNYRYHRQDSRDRDRKRDRERKRGKERNRDRNRDKDRDSDRKRNRDKDRDNNKRERNKKNDDKSLLNNNIFQTKTEIDIEEEVNQTEIVDIKSTENESERRLNRSRSHGKSFATHGRSSLQIDRKIRGKSQHSTSYSSLLRNGNGGLPKITFLSQQQQKCSNAIVNNNSVIDISNTIPVDTPVPNHRHENSFSSSSSEDDEYSDMNIDMEDIKYSIACEVERKHNMFTDITDDIKSNAERNISQKSVSNIDVSQKNLRKLRTIVSANKKQLGGIVMHDDSGGSGSSSDTSSMTDNSLTLDCVSKFTLKQLRATAFAKNMDEMYDNASIDSSSSASDVDVVNDMCEIKSNALLDIEENKQDMKIFGCDIGQNSSALQKICRRLKNASEFESVHIFTQEQIINEWLNAIHVCSNHPQSANIAHMPALFFTFIKYHQYIIPLFKFLSLPMQFILGLCGKASRVDVLSEFLKIPCERFHRIMQQKIITNIDDIVKHENGTNMMRIAFSLLCRKSLLFSFLYSVFCLNAKLSVENSAMAKVIERKNYKELSKQMMPVIKNRNKNVVKKALSSSPKRLNPPPPPPRNLKSEKQKASEIQNKKQNHDRTEKRDGRYSPKRQSSRSKTPAKKSSSRSISRHLSSNAKSSSKMNGNRTKLHQIPPPPPARQSPSTKLAKQQHNGNHTSTVKYIHSHPPPPPPKKYETGVKRKSMESNHHQFYPPSEKRQKLNSSSAKPMDPRLSKHTHIINTHYSNNLPLIYNRSSFSTNNNSNNNPTIINCYEFNLNSNIIQKLQTMIHHILIFPNTQKPYTVQNPLLPVFNIHKYEHSIINILRNFPVSFEKRFNFLPSMQKYFNYRQKIHKCQNEDHPFHHNDRVFYYETNAEVMPPLIPIIELCNTILGIPNELFQIIEIDIEHLTKEHRRCILKQLKQISTAETVLFVCYQSYTIPSSMCIPPATSAYSRNTSAQLKILNKTLYSYCVCSAKSGIVQFDVPSFHNRHHIKQYSWKNIFNIVLDENAVKDDVRMMECVGCFQTTYNLWKERGVYDHWIPNCYSIHAEFDVHNQWLNGVFAYWYLIMDVCDRGRNGRSYNVKEVFWNDMQKITVEMWRESTPLRLLHYLFDFVKDMKEIPHNNQWTVREIQQFTGF